MQKTLSRVDDKPATRRSARRAGSPQGSHPLPFDRHGDLVDFDFVDDHGANVVPAAEPYGAHERLLARSR